MTLVIPSSRFERMLADAEDAIAADAFVVLRFDEPARDGSLQPLAPARVATASPPSPSPPAPVRAPYLRREQRYRRRGVEGPFREVPPAERGLWLIIAACLVMLLAAQCAHWWRA